MLYSEMGTSISCSYSRVHNATTNVASREYRDFHKWMPSPAIFSELTKNFELPEIDLFASRFRKQLDKYPSCMPDPNSVRIDSMSVSCKHMYIYAFPLFNMIWQTISKISGESEKTPTPM